MNPNHIRIRVMTLEEIDPQVQMIQMFFKSPPMPDGSVGIINVAGQLEVFNDEDKMWYNVPIVATPKPEEPAIFVPPQKLII